VIVVKLHRGDTTGGRARRAGGGGGRADRVDILCASMPFIDASTGGVGGTADLVGPARVGFVLHLADESLELCNALAESLCLGEGWVVARGRVVGLVDAEAGET
jgi:hypothetical protein